MTTVSMLQFRREAAGIFRRIDKGESFVLSHRGRPVARLEPMVAPTRAYPANDPFLRIARRATRSPKAKTRQQKLDEILYCRG